MRLFVAAEPSQQLRAAAGSCAARLREQIGAAAAGMRWVPPENMHLTIWFLGEVSDARADVVLHALQPALDRPAFDVHVADFGVFPPTGPPRVLWMGVKEGLDELARAHEAVGARLQPWGFPAEGRAYSAHLTIARIKEPPHGAARHALREAVNLDAADAGSCRIRALTVFRSRTSARGAVYEPLLRVPLK